MKTHFARLFNAALVLLLLLAAAAPAAGAGLAPAAPSVFDCVGATQIPLTECRALVALYQGTNGAGWESKDGWLANDTPCDWYGVACAAGGGHVQSLDLSANRLIGGIPPEVGDLADLEMLLLYGNGLSGVIPPELGQPAKLVTLDLGWNQLSGAIPPELGQLATLKELYLRSNRLSGGVPADLGKLANLTTLYLEDNPLRGSLPRSLVQLPLAQFHFDSTQLCEPGDAAFQSWLAHIGDLKRSGATCSSTFLPLCLRQ